MAAKGFIGEFEQMVMLAVLQLGDGAVLSGIARELERRAGRDVSRGSLYTTLGRLETKAYVRWEVQRSTSEAVGNRQRRFEVTPAGVQALETSRRALLNLWEGLGTPLGDAK